ncbi:MULTISPECIES: carotenoid oxygenase family protein [Legionella]|uniref:Carotenoid oxygenase family protein n=1 Tax=Legionella resiliens TaxID=2905958 RepID=A0ABS8WWD2_9GAMM|nr:MULTISPECIES: carotenoid oxygenase family protein [unclassified Legionella]MCE0721616.1 carotenoid oxygenase family protein [Legionella sp. 9fVS26]MCE3530770.1 carotenoid oxygenase family protein [Legionella sp. 8cVS16]QLZ70331.1 Carotenoid cleavage oxygenase [Legionella sp. PC1000]
MNNRNNPYLSGNYAPVHDELDVSQLEILGEIPKDLRGVYMRNGPNPEFAPISYTYPYDGDGMIHAVYIAEGSAAYRNRFVETKGLLKERKAGKALYGGVMHPAPMDPRWAGPEDEPVAIKNGAFIHIIRHHDIYLALSESAPAYCMTAQLATLGEWKPYQDQHAIEVCAHTRFDPLNGELWFVNYALIPPYLTFYRLDKHGENIQKWDIEKPHCSMIHDFILTKNYVLIFDCPVLFDIQQMMSGGAVLSWRPELGVRIGVMPRAGGQIKWFHTEPFFVFHFANAYEQNHEIIIDYVRHEKIVLLTQEEKRPSVPPRLNRTVLNLKTETMKHSVLDERLVEFPRIREDQNSLSHQFIYTPTKTNTLKSQQAFNALIKYDVTNQRSWVYDFGPHAEIGEAVFAPASSHKSEDDGYLLLFVYDKRSNQSELVILDAQDFQNDPIARIKMPRRIPHGLHGSWMPGVW